jgi:two-component system sensor histidine kinase KdpD
MQKIENLPSLEANTPIHLSYVLLESILACGSALVITGFISIFNLYPRIPNISIVYLLPILVLASTFGRYAALLACLVASLSFDYFIVPPLYTFTMDRWEEWIALGIFLITALFTSQLTLMTRERTAVAQIREREARILYELIRLTNSRERFEDKLEVVMLSFLRVFASWGIYSCALLLPDDRGSLVQLLDVSSDRSGFLLTDEERSLALKALLQGNVVEQRYAPRPTEQDQLNRIALYTRVGSVDILRVLPLKTDEHVYGVLCLRVTNPVPWFASAKRMQEEQTKPDARVAFFWTFLEQAASLLERAHRQSTVLPSDR